MRAMALKRLGGGTVEPVQLPTPTPGAGEIRVSVRACGVCRTDLHVVDGELPESEDADRARGTRSSAA